MVLKGPAVPVAGPGHDEALTVGQVAALEGEPTAWAAVAVSEAGPVASEAARAVAVSEAGRVASEAARAVARGCSVVPLVDSAASRVGWMAVGLVPSRSSPLRFLSHLTSRISGPPSGRSAAQHRVVSHCAVYVRAFLVREAGTICWDSPNDLSSASISPSQASTSVC